MYVVHGINTKEGDTEILRAYLSIVGDHKKKGMYFEASVGEDGKFDGLAHYMRGRGELKVDVSFPKFEEED